MFQQIQALIVGGALVCAGYLILTKGPKGERLFALLVLIGIIVYGAITLPIKYGLDIAGGARVVYQLKPSDNQPVKPDHLQTVRKILDQRVNGMGVAESVVQIKGNDQVIVELPGVKNAEEILKRISSTGLMEWIDIPRLKSELNPGGDWEIEARKDDRGQEYGVVMDTVTKKEVPWAEVRKTARVIVDGSELDPDGIRAQYAHSGGFGTQVEFRLKAKGAKAFAEYTSRHVRGILPIAMDNRLISWPVINSAITGGEGVITMGSGTSLKQAQQLAEILKSGALPIPLEPIQSSSVDPTLGREAVEKTEVAGFIGLGAVLLFMLYFYRLPGLIASVALVFYSGLTLMIFKASEITLTLPGIAGFILSIGMAVDANILIFERLREEIRNGKTLHTAVEDGFKRAWPSIRDSNISTAITCLVLMGFGSGPVKGFAVTLLLGVAVSMFTAITVTHLLLDRVVQYPGTHKLSLFGVTKKYLASANIHRDLMGKMPLWFGISLLLIIPGAVSFISEGGLKLGIDFTGGSYIEAHFTEARTTTQVAEALRKDLGIESQVQVASNGRIAFIRTKPVQLLNLKDEKGAPVNDLTFQKMVTDSLTKSVGSLAITKEGDTERPVVSYSAVGPVIASEISQNAVKGIVFASLVILVYLAFVFRESTFADGVKFGACAIIAMIHDVLVLIGMMALAGALWGWEVDSLFITAALTVIGFSVHDSIVVFDRTRENWKMRAKGQSYQDIVNKSVLQTFRRSMFTSLTVLMVLAAMLIFGTGSNAAMTVFVSVLLVGIASGTYSSVFNASPLLVLWDGWAHGRQLAAATAGSGAVPLVPKNQAASQPQSESPSAAAARNGIEATAGGSPENKATAGTAKAKTSVKRKRRF